MEGYKDEMMELGTLITYPFESSAVVFIIDEDISLQEDSTNSILNASFVIIENDFDSAVACGNIEKSTTDYAFIDVNGIGEFNDKVSGQLRMKKEIDQNEVSISGEVLGIKSENLGLWISKEETKTRMCASSDDEIDVYMVNLFSKK